MANLTIDLSDIHPMNELSDEFSIEVLSKSKWHDYSDSFPFDGSVSQCCPAVPKDSLYVLAWQGSREQIKRFPYYQIIIPEGEDMTPVATGVSCLKAQNEFEFVKACLYKNYCTITFSIPDLNTDACYAILSSETQGLNLINGIPIPGEMCAEKPIINGNVTFTIPRLANEYLSLRISDENTINRVFDIYSLLASEGYDWNAQNLDDYQITLKSSTTH